MKRVLRIIPGKGFSLIELMVVIAVVAILASMALSSHQNSIQKSRRSSAKVILMEILSNQEQYFVNNKSYATALTNLGYADDTLFVDDQGDLTNEANCAYAVSFSAATALAFTIVATPKNKQAQDTHCASFTLSSTGLKGITGGSAQNAADCW